MVKSTTKETKVETQPKGWTMLVHDDGYTCILKSMEIEGHTRTVYVDDWSSQPVSVHTYELGGLEVSEDWNSIHDCQSLVHYSSHAEALTGLMEYLTPKQYFDVLDALRFYFGVYTVDELFDKVGVME